MRFETLRIDWRLDHWGPVKFSFLNDVGFVDLWRGSWDPYNLNHYHVWHGLKVTESCQIGSEFEQTWHHWISNFCKICLISAQLFFEWSSSWTHFDRLKKKRRRRKDLAKCGPSDLLFGVVLYSFVFYDYLDCVFQFFLISHLAITDVQKIVVCVCIS